jgi:hypothetical protein
MSPSKATNKAVTNTARCILIKNVFTVHFDNDFKKIILQLALASGWHPINYEFKCGASVRAKLTHDCILFRNVI